MPDDKAPIGRRKFLKTASLAGAVALSARVAKADEPTKVPEATPAPPSGATPVFSPDAPASSLVHPGKAMADDVPAKRIRDLLKLEPDRRFGYARDSYQGALYIPPDGLPAPFETGRPLGTALFFMVTPEKPVQLHRVQNDQLYHYYQGDPIEVLMLYESGTSELVVMGPNIVGGQLVQLFIPGGTFHTARITGHRRWFLGGVTAWPGVDPSRDVELGDAAALAVQYPEAAADLREFPQPAEPPEPAKPEPEPCPKPEDAEAVAPAPEKASAPEPTPAPEQAAPKTPPVPERPSEH
jgi:predicted cupin superfamily sugar epimerase